MQLVCGPWFSALGQCGQLLAEIGAAIGQHIENGLLQRRKQVFIAGRWQGFPDIIAQVEGHQTIVIAQRTVP